MEPFLTRQQTLPDITRVARQLAALFGNAEPDRHLALAKSLFAECVQCGIQVNGKELMDSADANPNPAEETKLTRLHLGFCARKGCRSDSYLLRIYRHVDLNWEELVRQIDQQVREDRVEEMQSRERTFVQIARESEQFKVTQKVAVGLGILILLLVARQYYVGGTIPLIRQPAKFEVIPATPYQRADSENGF